MGVEDFLREWNRKIDEQKKAIIANAAGFNPDSHKSTWWERNYLKVSMYSVLIISIILCYAFGFTLALRIMFMLLALIVVRFVWKKIKQVWTWCKTYRQAKKLLKQVSGLRRD